MFKREMKINLKSFIIWLSVLIGIFLIVFLVYPSIINSGNIKMIDEMMKMFPEEILKAFNMDISSMDSAFGWLKSEGFVFALLIIGCYSGILGSNILLKEENDKTIEYLNSLPIRRNDIIYSKVLSGLIYIILMVIIFGIFNYIGLSLSGNFDKKQFILLSITPLFSSIVIYFICMFLSTFMNKTKKMLGLSLGIVLISYVLQTLSTMAEETEFLKYFSVFTLSDIRNVIVDISINPLMIIISFGLSIVFLVLTIINYNKKELV
ncbi:MAG: ABC transporter permease subunit [Bacilli bacterium]|nr:ABC transporter permease subunit [Bacilli bacterium]